MTKIKQSAIFSYFTTELHTDYLPARAAEWVFLRSEQKVVVADFSYNHPQFRPHDLIEAKYLLPDFNRPPDARDRLALKELGEEIS